jgi:hypothetical protein
VPYFKLSLSKRPLSCKSALWNSRKWYGPNLACRPTDFLIRNWTKTDISKNLLARQNPTTNKIRYLVHLEDYRASAQDGILHALRVLETVTQWVDGQQQMQPIWDAGESFEDRLSTIKQDLTFLRDQLTEISKVVKELQQTLREHLDLTHNRRNFVLTLVAAIYLPLSFATSFFGMNMNTTTPAGPQGFSNWTASWIDDSPVGIRNSTKALVSTIGSSGTESYPWRTFIITSVCLLVTLPISLTFGTVFRLIYRSTTYYANYWRVLAVPLSVAFITISILGKFMVTGESSFSVAVTWCNVSLFSFAFSKVVMTRWRRRSGRTRFWILMCAVTCVCGVLDIFVYYFPFMIIPWLCFLYSWAQPWWRSRRRQQGT